MMIKKYILVLALSIAIPAFCIDNAEIKSVVDIKSATEILKVISSDEFEGRKPGTIGMEKSCEFVESYLKTNGIDSYFKNTYRDSLTVEGRSSYNIVGVIPASIKTNEYILIGAHIDHLGKISSETDSIYNGANDNATSVSAVLKIASDLKTSNLSKNVIIAIFTEEESGLNGSRHLASRLKAEGINLLYVVTFEMLGTPLSSDPTKVYITGYNISNFAKKMNKSLGYNLIKYEEIDDLYDLFRHADNYPFYEEFNIPAHTISSFDFGKINYYHKVDDEFEQIDTVHFEQIVNKCSAMILKLVNEKLDIKLTK